MKYLLIIWLINTPDLPPSSWAYINRYFSTLDDCIKRGEHEQRNMRNAYSYVCVQRPDAPVAA